MTDYPRFRYAQHKRGPYHDGSPIPPTRRARIGFTAAMAGAVAVVVVIGILLELFT